MFDLQIDKNKKTKNKKFSSVNKSEKKTTAHSPSSFVRRLSSINYSHFNLLLWNASTKWSKT